MSAAARSREPSGAGPRVLDLRARADADLSEVVAHIAAGRVVAYPTETVYGVGSACTTEGIAALRALKPRAAGKPFIALVPSADAVPGLRWSDGARELADIFWPGPVTLVLGDPNHTFPVGVRDERTDTVAVRESPHPVTRRLVRTLGAPLTSTSLNRPGEEPASAGDEAARVVRALGGDDVIVLDAGTLPLSGPSTIVDCTGSKPIVVREGVVPVGRLRCVFPEIHERTV